MESGTGPALGRSRGFGRDGGTRLSRDLLDRDAGADFVASAGRDELANSSPAFLPNYLRLGNATLGRRGRVASALDCSQAVIRPQTERRTIKVTNA
jgi:hypothetical protein